MANSTLKKIHLWDNKIDHRGAKHLAEALRVNTTLAEIELTLKRDWLGRSKTFCKFV